MTARLALLAVNLRCLPSAQSQAARRGLLPPIATRRTLRTAPLTSGANLGNLLLPPTYRRRYNPC
jgi:hypothetical protein